MSRAAKVTRPARVRCAIYTRKSTEEGLDQAFNSLHAQREACEAYVLSQAGEGWSALPTIYDDGGFSGGNMDRPALKALLADIDAGRVDVIVVYKVDRLTRSLADFAKIVEVLDARGASFVSVTQAFNTTTSMGRLTLNVLLSFAQFEREVTGERIRDKIAASKAKGIWMGGMVPLGYDAVDRELVINEVEAEQVRTMFHRYLELGSVPLLKDELQRAGVRSKRWTAESGRAMGGAIITCGAVFHILKNPLYRGQIVHKGEVHPGRHPPIVDEALFEAVQARLAENTIVRRKRPTRAANSPLAGLIFDAEGVLMSPSFAFGRGKRIYRYYVSASVLPKREHPGEAADAVRRVPAKPIEELVLDRLCRASGRAHLDLLEARSPVRRIQIRSDSVELVFSGEIVGAGHLASAKLAERLPSEDQVAFEPAEAGLQIRIIIPMRPVFRGGRTAFAAPAGQPNRRKANPQLIRGLRNIHSALKAVSASPAGPGEAMIAAEAPTEFQTRRMLPIAFLAPDIQRAIIEGRQPQGLTMKRMIEDGVPLAWADQRRKFGFADPVSRS